MALVKITCSECKGDGYLEGTIELFISQSCKFLCPMCSGKGYLSIRKWIWLQFFELQYKCVLWKNRHCSLRKWIKYLNNKE